MVIILANLCDFIWESIGVGTMRVGNYTVLKGDRREGTWWGEHSIFYKYNRTRGFGGNWSFLKNPDEFLSNTVSCKSLFKFLFIYMFSIFYVYSLTCTKHKNRYKHSKLITIIKKKKRMKGHSRMRFILLKTTIFSFLSFLNEVNHDYDR